MKSDNSFGLRPIWDASLEIYREVARICDKHGLRYYATYGTALGAVRHKGFIPWDDDFDIAMPRPHFERFKEIAPKELPTHLKFVDFHNTPEFRFLFGKVQDCRREKVEKIEAEVGHQLSNGLFIDIFPIEGYTNSAFLAAFFKFISRVFGKILRMGKVGTFISLHAYEIIAKLFSFEKSQLTGCSDSSMSMYYRKGMPMSIWGVAKKVEFDEGVLPIPADVDTLLKSVYGDYMQLPPKEKQHPTHSYAARCAWWLGPTR